MSTHKRAGPVRQLSLQPPHTTVRRPPLRKQSSEDIWDSESSGLRILANAIHSPTTNVTRTSGQVSGRPRPVKLAWTERKTASPVPEITGSVQVEVVARRCKGQPRPSTGKPPTQEQMNLSRQRLADRLRLAWQQRHPTRPNLDIFLAHNSLINRPTSALETTQKEVTLVLGETEFTSEKTDGEEKVCESLSTKKVDESSSEESCGDGSEESDQECEGGGLGSVSKIEACVGEEKAVILMRKAGTAINRNTNNSKSPPSQEGHSPPPPRRLMSAPPVRPRTATPQPQPTDRLQAQRRKLKTIRRRIHKNDEEISSGDDIEQKPRRSRSARTSEVVTMVSLLSPGHSEQEDEGEPTIQPLLSSSAQSLHWEDKLQHPNNFSTNMSSNQVQTSSSTVTNITTTPPIVCIRKPIKSVSFQHGSVNQSRSYTNNFPLRRGAATIPDDLQSTSSSPAPSIPALKRKLFSKMKSNTIVGTEPVVNEIVDTGNALSSGISTAPVSEDDFNVHETSSREQPPPEVSTPLVDTEDFNGNDEASTKPEFKSPKEQECWDLFRRMVDKGITVSFETVLRGMLTPTEYRLRKNDLLAS